MISLRFQARATYCRSRPNFNIGRALKQRSRRRSAETAAVVETAAARRNSGRGSKQRPQQRCVQGARSPLILRTSLMSVQRTCQRRKTTTTKMAEPFGIISTLRAWIAAKLVCSNRSTVYASALSCSAKSANDSKRKSACEIRCHSIAAVLQSVAHFALKSWAISRIILAKGALRIRRLVDFWYFLQKRQHSSARGRSRHQLQST